MELRQLRYFVRIVELGSMGRAARDFARPDAAARIVDALEELCRQAA